MSPPLVSIIIPCRNAAGLVGDAIRRALDQTWPHKEILVIDDGSTDSSLEVIRAFGDAIRLQTQPHRGAPAARNTGLRLARGDYIQFLDADDLLHPGKLERQVARAAGHDAITCTDGEARLTGGAIKPYVLPSVSDPVLLILQHDLPITAPLHPRAALDKVNGFREDLPCSQERDLHLRLACAGYRFTRLPEILFTVRKQPRGLSAAYLDILAQHERVFLPAHDILKANGQLTQPRARAFAERFARDARHYLQRGRRREALRYFKLARALHPAGGLTAFGRPYRLARAFLGPLAAERLAAIRRRTNP